MLYHQTAFLKSLFLNRIRQLPSKLNLNITSLCNSQCRTCNVWKLNRQNPEKVKDDLAEDEIKRILGHPELSICWLAITGGEPFLRQDLERILLYIINECPSIKMLTIPSNGLDKERIVSCLEKIKNQTRLAIYISFSLDGPPEIHDEVRGIKNAFTKTWETYNEVRKIVAGNKHFYVGFETTLSPYNIAHINPFVSTLIQQRHSVVFTIVHNAQFYNNKEDNIALLPRDSTAVKSLIDNLDRLDHGLSPHKVLRRVYLRNGVDYVKNPSKRILTCRALQTSLTIDPNGMVTPCLMWDRSIGNVRDQAYNVMSLWKSSVRLDVRKQIFETHCPNCWTPCEAYLSIMENFYRLPVLKNIL